VAIDQREVLGQEGLVGVGGGSCESLPILEKGDPSQN